MKNIYFNNLNGFSLLEVMIALLLFGISITSLVLVQARATNLAINSKNISLATTFARTKLSECKPKVKKIIQSMSDFKDEGNFSGIGYEKFSWECHAPKFNMSHLSSQQVEKAVKGEAPEALKSNKNTGISSSVMQMITDGLGDAVRELTVIIRWKENGIDEEMRVVTHVTDVNAMARLSLMLGQGASMINNQKPKGDDAVKPGLPPGEIPR